MRVAIVGSRHYSDLDQVREYVRSLHGDTEVVSGGALGVDAAAVIEARRLGLTATVFPADWERDGKAAGFIRNQLIADYCDRVVAFWDGESRGTIKRAQRAGKPVEVRR